MAVTWVVQLGFSLAMVPRANAPKQKIAGTEIIAAERVEQTVEKIRQ